MSFHEIVVVGAGAAGIGATRRLAAAGRDVLLLEARMRVGGRAVTVDAGGDPVDLGCEWLHSGDVNPLTPLAREHRLAVNEKLPDWGERLLRRNAGAEEIRDWQRARDGFEARLEAAERLPGDRPAADFLEPGNRWNGTLDAISTWANGAELEHVSVRDHALYADSGINWRIAEGYGTLFERLAAGLPIRLGTRVTAIDHGGREIAVETTSGTIRARAVIVTLPTPLMANGALRFRPALPEKAAAAAGLPLGLANKLFLRLEPPFPDVPPEGHVLGRLGHTDTGSYQVRPHGRNQIAAYFGGALARRLEKEGIAGMASFARAELAQLFGSDLARRLSPLAASAWAADPWAEGSYSCALPGHAGDRAILAAPVDGRLFFAGEATSPNWFSTAHGAWTTGEAAAAAILESAAAR